MLGWLVAVAPHGWFGGATLPEVQNFAGWHCLRASEQADGGKEAGSKGCSEPVLPFQRY